MKKLKIFLLRLPTLKIIIFPPRGLGQRRSGSQLQFVISGDTYENIYKNMQIILKEIENNENFLFSELTIKIDLN